MLNQNRHVVPDPAGIQRAVFLLNDLLDMLPRDRWILIGEPVHHMAECPQFFIDSHFRIVSSDRQMFKTGLYTPAMLQIPSTAALPLPALIHAADTRLQPFPVMLAA